MASRLLFLCALILWPGLPAGLLRAQSASVVPTPTTLAAAGGTVSFSVHLNYTGELSALGFQAVLPAGWTYGAAAGAQVPQIAPRRGDRGPLEFAWFAVPTGPARFTFTADYPAGLAAAQTVSALAATFRRSGAGASQVAVADLVFPAPGAAVVKLVNISTRSRTGTAAETLIAGFFLAGDRPQTVLVRGIGPTLAVFGVGGALPAARLELFREQTRLSVGDDWGAAANRDAVASAAATAGAFALAPASRDAAVLVTLEPGAYTAVVSGQGGAAGVALAEVYAVATPGAPAGVRIANLSARAFAGAGDESLIAGFVIEGAAPKRVLVRGAGPALAAFGVAAALARAELTVVAAADSGVRGTNAGWSAGAEAAAIEAAAAQVGAFAFARGSADAALLLTLAPGGYTARVAGAAGATGTALVEVYEVP